MTNYLGTTNAITSTGGGSTTLSVVNNSSVERFENEKVWIRQIVGGWEIIDWASADINSLTGKCDSAIAVGGIGTVSLTDDGVIMTHLVRDFSLGSGVAAGDIDDAIQQFTSGNYSHSDNGTHAYRYITSRSLNITTANYRNNMLIKFSYKLVPVLPETLLSSIASTYIAQLTKTSSDSWQNGIQNLPEFAQYNNYFRESTVYSGTSSDKLEIPNSNIIDFNKWINVEYKLTNNPVTNKLTISDSLGNSKSAQDNRTGALGTPLQRFNLGVNVRNNSSNPLFDIVFDLSKTGLYTADGSTALWTPYKQSVV